MNDTCSTAATPRKSSSRLAVIGGGILGLMTALLCAEDGLSVTVVERGDRLWQGASMAGEGKVHLGPVYAMGGSETAYSMLRGALRFAPLVEQALGGAVDWSSLCTEPFSYMVMPGSLIDAGAASAAYRRMNDLYAREQSTLGTRYLGAGLKELINPQPMRDPATGLTTFRSSERCVDPLRLGVLLERAVLEHPRIAVATGTEVISADAEHGQLELRGAAEDAVGGSRFAAIVNCAWDDRARLERRAGADPPMQNVRVKASVRVPPEASRLVVTLVQGPFGDVVRHRDYTYLSWYPVGRVHHEYSPETSPAAISAAHVAGCSHELARAQIKAMAQLGLVDGRAEVVATAAGVVLGHGEDDIHRPDSMLHHRADFGVRVHGRMITPDNYKFSTAPLAADTVRRALREQGRPHA